MPIDIPGILGIPCIPRASERAWRAKMHWKAVALVVIGLLVPSAELTAQTVPVGTIRGTTVDQQGAVLPGVTVTAESPTVAGSKSAVTDLNGTYRLVDLPPGIYTLRAELQGFKRTVRPDVAVQAGLNLVLDLELTVGGVEETVQVDADTPMIERQSTTQTINVSGDLQ